MTNASNQTAPCWAGIDVAKGTFEAALHPAWIPGKGVPLSDLPRGSFPRTAGGVASFLDWLDGGEPSVTRIEDNIQSFTMVIAAMEATLDGQPRKIADYLTDL